MSVLMTVWHNWAGELAAFRTVIAPIRPGDVVLTVQMPEGTRQPQWIAVTTARRLSDGAAIDGHLPALLVIEHRAWWPFLFDNESQQPIETREPFRALATRIDNSPDPIALLVDKPQELRLVTHVLLYGRGPFPAEIAALKPLAANNTAALFAVARAEISRSPQPVPPTGR
jgi:hypothetical protein